MATPPRNLNSAPLAQTAPQGLLGINEDGELVRILDQGPTPGSGLPAGSVIMLQVSVPIPDGWRQIGAPVSLGGVPFIIIEMGDGPAPGVAPALVTPGFISPASGPVGTVFTITPPVFSGSQPMDVARTMTLADAPITVTGNSYTSTAAGALVAAWSASNGIGLPATSSASATVTAAGTAPVITQQPSISPANPVAGQTVTINWGAATGTPAPTQDRVFLMDGSDASSQLTGNSFVAQEGQYVVDGAWTNSSGTTPVVPVTFEVAGAPAPEIDYDTMAIAYFNAENAITGTDSDVLTMTARGTGGVVYQKTGTGAAITRTADGFVFADGAYLQAQNLTGLPTTDGMFAVASFTLDSYGSNSGIIVDGTNGHLKLRNNNGNFQFLAQDDTARSMGLGAAIYGTRITIAGEVDDVTDVLRAFNIAGSLVTDPTTHPGMTDPSLGRLIHGRYIIGTIHEFAIFGKPEGGDWPVTMEAVFADFTGGA